MNFTEMEQLAATLHKNRSIDIGRIVIFRRQPALAFRFDEQRGKHYYRHLFWHVWLKPANPPALPDSEDD